MQGNITGNKEGKVHQVRENKSLEEKGVRGGRREEESKCCFSKPLSLSVQSNYDGKVDVESATLSGPSSSFLHLSQF